MNVKYLTIEKLLTDCNLSKKDFLTLCDLDSKYVYDIFLIPKKTTGFRTIRVPNAQLKILQCWINKNVLSKADISKFCKSYRKNMSIVTNARLHKNQKIVLKLDIADFFSSISWSQVYKIFVELNINEEISEYFAKLVTINDGEVRLGIPQGACTSPTISNCILKDFDNKLGSYCIKRKIRYTRYADDLTFSGDFNYKKVILFVKKLLDKFGFKLNNSKIRVMKSGQSQIVTGIQVNEKIQVPRKYRHNLRLEIYHILNHPNDHFKMKNLYNSAEKSQYLKSVLGKVNYILQVNKKDGEFIKYKNLLHKILVEVLTI
ncbi:reverse transcriptase domain-containing protein [Enterococcus columbae]|uniref:RNA-directed DNA polymerase n=1 Tax=Enterococcus columbae DSM 7374 = ATCC 51263 TaxID=1121865 RepID=S1MU46_9ENTE|nr:reverse transcriptase domain-containing protein [Enterococcus columbae]EOT40434.1 hypothetical protein OMW_01296 [Enterococcus columbae DSM 7374 = ATCC 51263]EOW80210.1 hypothetical protein I568_01910 [Enterococcus columbae DSM 7374 = ATCC 51263]OJG21830.1 hypothetical protein RR47_GL001156 [Enterococcus columbae DSM 7374 = ATCC 51263]